MPLVIFVTAYDRYTLKAFEVHALDYLLKPFDEARLAAALGRAKRELEFRRTYQRSKLTGLMETVAERRGLKRFPIKSAGRTVFIQLDEIDYLEAAGNYVRLHTGGNEYLTRDTMSSFEAKLSESVSRSYVRGSPANTSSSSPPARSLHSAGGTGTVCHCYLHLYKLRHLCNWRPLTHHK